MRTGDKVLISPDLTHAKDWTPGEVIEVENNPFVGIVISAKTADGNIFFGYKDLFEPAKEYNPQNEMLAFCKTKCSIRKTKRIFSIIPS